MTRRVVVVGAGLAGLATAVGLEEAGVEVVVLEARTRLGGRVHTWTDGARHADLGAERVDGDHHRVHALAERVGDGLIRIDDDVDLTAIRISDGVVETVDEVAAGPVGEELTRIGEHLSSVAADLPDLDDPTTHPEAAQLDGRSVADLLDELAPAGGRSTGAARRIVEQEVRFEAAVEPERLSLLAWIHDVAVAEAKPPEQIESHRIRGGAHRLVAGLRARLRAPVHLATPARTIDLREGGARITTDRSSLDADAVVLAVPPTVARHVRFDGVVPPVVETLAGLGMGDITKRLLRFATPVWRESGSNGTALIEPGSLATWEGHSPEVLIVYAGGQPAHRLAAMALEELLGLLPATWRRGPVPEELPVAHWGGVPEIGGAWNAPAPGQVCATWHTLRRPHGALHLAGEHTGHRHAGFMEGALESAERVVDELTR